MSSSIKSFFGNIKPKTYLAFFLALIIILGSGFLIGYGIAKTNNEPFQLNLVETMANKFNGTSDAMPSYFMVTNNGLVHPVTITVPSNRWIELTITTYDMGNLTINPKFLQVSGTKNNQITIINGSMAMMDNYAMPWQKTVTSVPASEVLHTFTVSDLNINIPVIAGTVEIAYIYITKTGTFSWQCMAPCGTGGNGWSGPMATPGWMSGTFIVT